MLIYFFVLSEMLPTNHYLELLVLYLTFWNVLNQLILNYIINKGKLNWFQRYRIAGNFSEFESLKIFIDTKV